MSESPTLTVQQVMRVHVPTLHPDSTFRDAVDKFHLYQVTLLPVVEEDRQVVGVVSRSDAILYALEGAQASLEQAVRAHTGDRVGQWMSPASLTVELEEPVQEAVVRMLAASMDVVPVLVEGRLAGTLCVLDILQAVLTDNSAIL